MPSTRHIEALFSIGDLQEATLCHPQRRWLGPYSDVCNFTLMNGGASWYCQKPRNSSLLCEDWTHIRTQTPFPEFPLTSSELYFLRYDFTKFIYGCAMR